MNKNFYDQRGQSMTKSQSENESIHGWTSFHFALFKSRLILSNTIQGKKTNFDEKNVFTYDRISRDWLGHGKKLLQFYMTLKTVSHWWSFVTLPLQSSAAKQVEMSTQFCFFIARHFSLIWWKSTSIYFQLGSIKKEHG